MIENLKTYTDEKFKYYVRAPNNNLLNVPENKYTAGITSPHLNENHITTSSPFIVGSNDNIQGVSITANPVGSPLTSVMQTSEDDYNRLSPVNLSPINLSPGNISQGNLSPHNGDYRYLNLGNTEFRCLSPNNSDISEGVRSNHSGVGYLENLPE